jgi:excinuclease ABC subunit A
VSKVDGKFYEIEDIPALDKKLKHDIEGCGPHCRPRDDLGNRLADSVETAVRLADGLVIAENADSGEQTLFSKNSPARYPVLRSRN